MLNIAGKANKDQMISFTKIISKNIPLAKAVQEMGQTCAMSLKCKEIKTVS